MTPLEATTHRTEETADRGNEYHLVLTLLECALQNDPGRIAAVAIKN